MSIDGVGVQFDANGELVTEDELTIKVLSANPDVKGKAKKEDKPVTEKAKRAKKDGNNIR